MADAPPIRVVFDAHALTPHRSGIGEYSHQLLHALLREQRENVAMHLFVPGGIRPVETGEELASLTAGVRDGDLYRPAHLWQLPRLLRAGSYDLLHCPDFFVPLRAALPVVCTIHDLIPLVHPEYIPKSMKVRMLPVFRAWVRRALRSSARIITDSRHSADDIRRLFPAASGEIDAIPLAPTVEVTGVPLPAEFAVRLRAGRYLLYVGRHDPYKGVGLLLRAFASAVRDGGMPGDVQLAIAGRRDPRYDMVAEAERLGLSDRCVFLDYVAGSQLSPLYAHAMGLVFPSLYEGFGLPVLDAMRHGLPVICSDRASLPEVAGDAAMLVDPEQSDSFAGNLKEFVKNTTLRSALMEKGKDRVRQFSWNHTAAATVVTYRKAIA
ncbi:MAG: glycosyltransferase family 1 protein [Bacteroidota bacterium]|nr:glycosyltransferase family 1 protein [Bacteroidota bacterium]